MSFVAYDSEGSRVDVLDAVKGQKYFCQTCKQELIFKDCTLRAKHFAHYPGKDGYSSCCDTWKYDMSEWHRGWQLRFPLENREVVVSEGGQKHIADVLINNTVIEFQHSKLSAGDFQKRNEFYTSAGLNVIWVFDMSESFESADAEEDPDITERYSQSGKYYTWSRPWPLFSKGFYPERIENVAVFFQFFDSEDDGLIDAGRPLERIKSGYSGFKTFYTDSGHPLKISEFVRYASDKSDYLLGKDVPEPVHRVEGGKTVKELWQDTFKSIMVRNMATRDVMVIYGNYGHIEREYYGSLNYVVGYYCGIDKSTGKHGRYKKHKYPVLQADDSVWEPLQHFDLPPEVLEKIQKEKEEQAEKERRRQKREEEQKRLSAEAMLQKQARLEMEALRKRLEIENRPAMLEGTAPVYDFSGNRLFLCGCCGSVLTEADIKEYRFNIGTCKDCWAKGMYDGSSRKVPDYTQGKAPKRCPDCGRALIKVPGPGGLYYKCPGCGHTEKC